MPAHTRSPRLFFSPRFAALLAFSSALAAGGVMSCGGAGGGTGGSAGGGEGGSGGASACAEDCSANPGAPVCDPATGQCVVCLPGSAAGCPAGQYCAADSSCVPGCVDQAGCAGGLVCDPATHQCVGCVADSDCPPGNVCSAGQCAPGCSASQPCGGNLTCCTDACQDLQTDVLNCGACGNACPTAPHTQVTCDQGVCQNLGCEQGYDDCNQDSNDGCEHDLANGPCTCTPGDTMPCYQGPPNTLGVGACQGGTATCLATGDGWGTCVGQVLPTNELCADNIDQNCDGLVDNVPDLDGDGYTVCNGDCCDSTLDGCTDPQHVNPGAIEVPGTMVDEDCDGTVDNVPGPCDANLALTDTDPAHAAWAIELCKASSGAGDWGVVSSQTSPKYVRANGTVVAAASQQYGILSNFGPNVAVQAGTRMLGLSSGRARLPGQAGACGTQSCTGLGSGTAPAGFPQNVAGCPVSTAINDDIALQVQLRAPTNATGYKFKFKFYSFEYPEWVCDDYNDQFIALVSPPPVGSINGNISFDSLHNPVSVNVAFFDVCQGCPLGTADLSGTGFDTWNDAGATGWLQTTAPIGGGQTFSIRFAIWDTGDQYYDSTVLVDAFEWIADGSSVVVGTGATAGQPAQ